ncbi:tRNA(Met) cytidine acetyltransferase [Marinomonas sp. M1K-6]|uniref:tRNA(Met) cytidine acetyltransferase TmcA n=1 Tax=Marinomonas profundi TaxID=2726122 RepID=A0A847R3D4_9GAMM|nr:GNAT family N-acetyltransferase [Marinomonas profundi]NLQ16456.1 tRNA(Met) cytidine acetyltransferase [Marinomonas profundi]UDV03954.1 tRNA(Met) cytidine acetyltransferase [Marinomonas profundi]
MSSNHRHCFLLKGSPSEVLSDFLCLSKNLSTRLVAAHNVSEYDALLAPPFETSAYKTCAFKQTRQTLGSSYDAILVDLTHGVSASALAILSGTVRGNGLFAIALPQENWLPIIDQDLPRYLPWPYKPEQVESHFKRYLLDHLQSTRSPFQTLVPNNLVPSKEQTDNNNANHIKALPALKALEHNAPLTQEQADAQACLLAEQAKSYVLIAPRGRGKSTLLGDSLATLLKAGKRVAITAPHQGAIVSLKARFESRLSQFDIDADLPFFAPDALVADATYWDFLFIDEASMIPLPLLMALNQKAKHCLFSTTDYGYEGAGKGFGIRFCRDLAAQKTTKRAPLQSLILSQPIRWGGNDPLEKWINDGFFLAPAFPQTNDQRTSIQKTITQQTTTLLDTDQAAENTDIKYKPDIEYKTLIGKAWLENTTLLASTFNLLVSAHYQTSPDNLRWVLDDPSMSAYLSMQGSALNSVAIVTTEGDLPEALSLAVLQGIRRPRGHLVPQSLLAHEGFEDAGQFRYWRISRIATEPRQQQQGFASQLLTHIETAALGHCDFLSTSFAATPDVTAFWLKNGYRPVRLGTAKDQASGCYSLMMIKPMTEQAEQSARHWQQCFIERFSINILVQYADISTALLMLMLKSQHLHIKQHPALAQLSQHDLRDIALFTAHHRPFDSIRPAFLKAALSLTMQGKLTPNNPSHRLLMEAALGKSTEQTRQQSHLSGKKAMLQSFKTLFATHFPEK